MNKKWWIPVIVVFLFGIEGIIPNFIPSMINNQYWIIVPRFLYVLFILIIIFYDRKLGLIYAFCTGIIMDLVFTEILGIYLFLYPTILYLTAKLVRDWYSNLFIVFFVTLFSITALEFAIYGMYSVLNIAGISMNFFIYHRLLPTLALNSVFYIVVSFPLKSYFEKIKKVKEEEEGMFQS